MLIGIMFFCVNDALISRSRILVYFEFKVHTSEVTEDLQKSIKE